jgi:outer membrane protein OmpA-like peptidoglycan-associated protein
MASKKHMLLGALLTLGISAMAQVTVGGGSYNPYDSTIVPQSRNKQYQEFMGGQSAYPAKPRNQWEIGAQFGILNISGDVPVRFFTFGQAIHVRKSLGYIFSLRLQYLRGIGKGLHWLEANNFQKNSAWNKYDGDRSTYLGTPLVPGGNNFPYYFHDGPDKVFYNYRTRVQDLGLQGIITLNNVRFHKRKTGAVIYGIAGIGATLYQAKVNAEGVGGASYKALFNGITSATHPSRKAVIDRLRDNMDKTYETDADNHGPRRPKIGGNTLKPSGTVGVGVAYRINRTLNISLENRHTFVKDDLLDGQRWQEHARGDAVMTRDFDSYNMFSLGLNANLGAKSVEPLWWQNPLDYQYSVVPDQIIKKAKYVPRDGDGDGVVDEMDKEPNTPAGCPVDTHGVTADRDGDGVPDCKDKEMITPTQCQPVDADGIGKCPEPECCAKALECCKTVPPPATCSFSAPTVDFRSGSCTLSSDAKAALDQLANDMKGSATCNVTVSTSGVSKQMQKLAECRHNAIKSYLVSKGVSESRINVVKNTESDSNTADISIDGQ